MGFTAPGVQSLIGVELTPALTIDLDQITPEQAAATQISIWKVAQDTSLPLYGVIDPASGNLQFKHNGTPFTSVDVPQTYRPIPEPNTSTTFAGGIGVLFLLRRRRHS